MKKILPLFALLLALPLAAQPKHAMLGAAMGQSTPASPYITLTWTASPTTGSLVNVYRCIGTPCTSTSSFTQLTTGVAIGGPYNDTTVTDGAIYVYYITATKGGLESGPSNFATVSVLPQPPTGLTTTATP